MTVNREDNIPFMMILGNVQPDSKGPCREHGGGKRLGTHMASLKHLGASCNILIHNLQDNLHGNAIVKQAALAQNAAVRFKHIKV